MAKFTAFNAPGPMGEQLRIWARSKEGKDAIARTAREIDISLENFDREMKIDPEIMRKPVDF